VSGLRAPFPWFGGKRTVADQIWSAIGDVSHYVEPFFGSGAVLLNRPHAPNIETVNDKDGMVANFWRAVRLDPESVAHHADWPVSEPDLHARHLWLVAQRESITERLMGGPEWFDAKVAGWWVWGACNWIGSGFCSGQGPWVSVDGVFTDSRTIEGDAGQGINRKLPHLGNAGQGINRQLPHLGNAGQGINRKLPHLGNAGRGINRQLPHLGDAGRGINRQHDNGDRHEFILKWMQELSERLRETRVACGDWKRVTGSGVFRAGGGYTGVFLDPPYSQELRSDVYAVEASIGDEVESWCIENGKDPKIRIVVAGYQGEHSKLESEGWSVKSWKAGGGYGNQGSGRGAENSHKERLWLSPHCLTDFDMFGEII
jgi:site-specific DNA-adenine methylase